MQRQPQPGHMAAERRCSPTSSYMCIHKPGTYLPQMTSKCEALVNPSGPVSAKTPRHWMVAIVSRHCESSPSVRSCTAGRRRAALAGRLEHAAHDYSPMNHKNHIRQHQLKKEKRTRYMQIDHVPGRGAAGRRQAARPSRANAARRRQGVLQTAWRLPQSPPPISCSAPAQPNTESPWLLQNREEKGRSSSFRLTTFGALYHMQTIPKLSRETVKTLERTNESPYETRQYCTVPPAHSQPMASSHHKQGRLGLDMQ